MLKANKTISTHRVAAHGGRNSNSAPGLIDFSSNISPIIPKFVKRLNTALVSQYPDPQYIKLRNDIAKYTKTSLSNVLVGNGAIEIIYDFCRTFLNNTISTLIVIPTFSEYESAAKLMGSKIKFYKTMNLNLNLKSFLKKIPHNGCIFLCNPNNPTGIILKQEAMHTIIQTAQRRSSFVFIDECFMDLATSDQSMLKFIKKYSNMLILKSFTKSFALAGLRIGFAISSKNVTSAILKSKIPWSVNGLASQAASLAISDKSHLKTVKLMLRNETQYLKKSISILPKFECFDTSVNFMLAKTIPSSKYVQRKLLSQNILVRDCSTFRGLGQHFIRISIQSHNNNVKLIKALRTI